MRTRYVPPHLRGSDGNTDNTNNASNNHGSSDWNELNQDNAASYSNQYGNTNTNNNTKSSNNFADADTTNYDLGFSSSTRPQPPSQSQSYGQSQSAQSRSYGGGGGGDNHNSNSYGNKSYSNGYNNDRFNRYGGGSGGGRGGGGGGGGRGRGQRGGGRGGDRGDRGGRGRMGGGDRFSRPSGSSYGGGGGSFGGSSFSSRGGGGGGGGGNYSTYTDRYSNSTYSSSLSTDRNMDLEKELFGSEDHVTEGINFSNYDKIPVEVSGHDAPEAVNSFDETNLHQTLMSNIALCQYHQPTPIQKYAIPCVMGKRDLMACAQTGSGKTAAFLLPIIHNLMEANSSNARNGYYNKSSSGGYGNREVYPSAVILSPTRELAIQIHIEARKFLYRTGLRTCVVYGGADWRKQSRDLRYGVDIIVATPGRLNDFMERGFLKMSNVQFNVLDEADRMLDMGFMPQIKQIINEMPPKTSNMSNEHGFKPHHITRQTLMFSATFPLEIQKLAQEFLYDYVFIAVGRVGSTNSFIDQTLKFVEEYEKSSKLVETVSQMTKTEDGRIPLTLVFVEKKRDAARVERDLIRSGFDAMSIHGDRTQKEREHALKMFRCGKVSLLVATDVASRGLDIPNVLYVINYDLPSHIDSYVHRIGRTGRCGNNGNAISFVNENNKPIIKPLMQLLKESKAQIPQWFADLSYKYSPYSNNYSSYGYSNYKGGNKRGYGGGGGGGGSGRFGARDFRHGNNSSSKRGGYKRNTYDHYNSGGGGGGGGVGGGSNSNRNHNSGGSGGWGNSSNASNHNANNNNDSWLSNNNNSANLGSNVISDSW